MILTRPGAHAERPVRDTDREHHPGAGSLSLHPEVLRQGHHDRRDQGMRGGGGAPTVSEAESPPDREENHFRKGKM